MIRELVKTDFRQLQGLYKQLSKLRFVNRPDVFYDRQPITASYFQQLLTNKNVFCFVYEENKKLLGSILFQKISPLVIAINKPRTIFKIIDVAIDYEHRYGHIGADWYEFVENMARENKIDAIESEPWIFDFEAIKFYESIGMNVRQVTYEKILNENYYEKTKPVTLNTIEKVVK